MHNILKMAYSYICSKGIDYKQSWKTIWIKNFSLPCDVLDLSTEILKLTILFGLKKSTFFEYMLLQSALPPKK